MRDKQAATGVGELAAWVSPEGRVVESMTKLHWQLAKEILGGEGPDRQSEYPAGGTETWIDQLLQKGWTRFGISGKEAYVFVNKLTQGVLENLQKVISTKDWNASVIMVEEKMTEKWAEVPFDSFLALNKHNSLWRTAKKKPFKAKLLNPRKSTLKGSK